MSKKGDDSKQDSKGEEAPPPYAASSGRPPSGYRIALGNSTPFPSRTVTKVPPCYDEGGTPPRPVFLGSAIFNASVHPCKIVPHLAAPCHVPYGGSEIEHKGRYDLLPFDPDTMEWVPTSLGRLPVNRVPIAGGYEENGANLFHALATVRGVKVPGKTGQHLGGCNVAFGEVEHVITRGYDILCWK